MDPIHCARCGRTIYIGSGEGNTYSLTNLYGQKQFTYLNFNACNKCLNKIIRGITDIITKEESK